MSLNVSMSSVLMYQRYIMVY